VLASQRVGGEGKVEESMTNILLLLDYIYIYIYKIFFLFLSSKNTLAFLDGVFIESQTLQTPEGRLRP